MAIDAFLKMADIPGESLDAQFKDWIEMEDFDVGASQSASATTTSSGGATSGRAKMSDLYFRKAVDKATPLLQWQALQRSHHRVESGGQRQGQVPGNKT
jgi:type VI secretion system secreted protein Hcp